MIIISAGHTQDNPGERIGRYTEHAEAMLWAEELDHLLSDCCVFIPSSCIKEKIKFVKQLSAGGDVKLWVEIHFNGVRFNKNTPQVQYNKNHDVTRVAETVVESMRENFGEGEIIEGYYRGIKNKGMDFLLKDSPVPTILILPTCFNNIENIKSRRVDTCSNIARAIRSFYNGNNKEKLVKLVGAQSISVIN